MTLLRLAANPIRLSGELCNPSRVAWAPNSFTRVFHIDVPSPIDTTRLSLLILLNERLKSLMSFST